MTLSKTRIKPEVLEVLKSLKITNKSVEITVKLERELYEQVNKIIKSLRGKWKGGKVQKFMFEHNFFPDLTLVIESGLAPLDNPYAFFPTPQVLIEDMMRLADLDGWERDSEHSFLEPSAGDGRIAMAIKDSHPKADLDLVEFDVTNQTTLIEKGFKPICTSFLDYNVDYEKKYNYILMNPPFSYEGSPKAYIEHINHAFAMLKESGKLIAVAPVGFYTGSTKMEKEFLDMCLKQGTLYHNEKEAFKESNTLVQTCLIEIDKRKCSNLYDNDFKSLFSYHFCLNITNEDKFMKKLDLLHASAQALRSDTLDLVKTGELVEGYLDTLKDPPQFPLTLKDEYVFDLNRIYAMDAHFEDEDEDEAAEAEVNEVINEELLAPVVVIKSQGSLFD